MRGQPLAERMRPSSLAEYVGQEHLLGSGRWLRRAIESKSVTSLILWGPPGTGKTTLGRLLAAEIKAGFAALSAVMSGVNSRHSAVPGSTVIVVTNEVGWGVVSEYRSGRLFADELGRVNQQVAAASDRVVLMVAGRPLTL